VAEGAGPGVGSWEVPGGAVEVAGGAAPGAPCKAGGWACSICCWAEESVSLSLSWGLGMLGDVLRLSWSMSLGSLLPSSLTLRLSELSPSPSDGELGRLISWVFVFLELLLSASSVSEATFSRWRLVLFRGDEASSFTFLADFFTVSALLSLLEVLAALGEFRPLERMSSLMGEARPSGLAGCFFRPLRSVDICPPKPEAGETRPQHTRRSLRSRPHHQHYGKYQALASTGTSGCPSLCGGSIWS